MVNRVKANSITITVDGDDYTADLSSIGLQSEEASSDVTTFADATSGGARDFYIEMSGVTSTDATSFFMVCWNNAGDEVPFTLETTSATAGEFAGTLRLPAKGLKFALQPLPKGERFFVQSVNFRLRFGLLLSVFIAQRPRLLCKAVLLRYDGQVFLCNSLAFGQ